MDFRNTGQKSYISHWKAKWADETNPQISDEEAMNNFQ